ncbi:recombinase family protein [Mesorhizobium sp. LjNodule214]
MTDEDGAAQTARLLKAGCDRVYLERSFRQPHLVTLLGTIKSGDVLVVDDLSRLAPTPGKLSMVLGSLRILDAGLVSIADKIDTVDWLPNQAARVFEAFDRLDHPRKADNDDLDNKQIAAARLMLSSQTMSVPEVAAQLGVKESVLLQKLGANWLVAQVLISSLHLL